MFQINFGKQQLVFPPSHPYFKRLPKEQEHLLKEKSRTELRRILDNAEEYKKFIKDKNYKDVKFDWTTGGLKAMHREHNFDKKKGHYEKEVMDILYNHGGKIILMSESSNIDGQKQLDGLLNGRTIEISTKENGKYKRC